ncbi:hypothetical protein JCM19231_5664 [Vibrio ishigakensis]|uniref:DUF5666 domain-containing protein n=1 Tax=Vibrio ishigakensis TaxID=1481914 RepID=A0A0B8NUR1_9VIBR|nr:hypothetical protein [Vibrio ishigakensis]GAM56027.1 hypothetical protein JCM19231_5664 [Vibrio ishigakensis]
MKKVLLMFLTMSVSSFATAYWGSDGEIEFKRDIPQTSGLQILDREGGIAFKGEYIRNYTGAKVKLLGNYDRKERLMIVTDSVSPNLQLHEHKILYAMGSHDSLKSGQEFRVEVMKDSHNEEYIHTKVNEDIQKIEAGEAKVISTVKLLAPSPF